MNDFAHLFTRHFLEKAPQFVMNVSMALIILAAGYFISKFASRSTRQILSKGQGVTVAPIVAGLVKVALLGASFVTALSHLGIDVGAILAGAGVLGLAVGFGAQTLVKDLISGFFLIFDGVMASGDTVKMEHVEGVVEGIGLRVTRIRGGDGRLWYIPNGSIVTVANYSRSWGRVIVDVNVAHQSDFDKALYAMKAAADSLSQEKKQSFLEAPETQGILGANDSGATLRVMAKVKADDRGALEIELRKRVLESLREAGIQNAYPHRVVLQK